MGLSRRFWRWAGLIVLLGLAAFLRLHALDRLPPGLYHDEAFYAQDAQHVLHDGRLALFFAGNFGREPLHIYLLAGAMALFGENTFALRLVTAFSGLLSVPLAYGAARALLRSSGPRGVWAAALAATLMAVSYWHVNFSRVAFRAIHLVPLSLLAVWLLARAAHRRSMRLFALSGLALGLCQYTYLAARLLPLVFAGLAAVQAAQAWLLQRQPLPSALRQPLVRGSVVALLVAALVSAPLGVYFLQHPAELSGRSAGLSIFGPRPAMPDPLAPPPSLASNLVAVTRMFIDQGDQLPRHNLPGRPAADALGLLGFWAGLAAALATLRRPQSQLLLLWLVTMLLPTALSIEAPHFLRAIGAIPPLCMLAGDGLARLWQRFARPGSPAWPALVAAVALISGGLTGYDYFVRWPRDPRLIAEFDVARYTLAQQALALSAQVDVAVPLDLYTHPTALFVLEPAFRRLAPIDSAPPGERPLVVLAPPGARPRSLVVLRRVEGQPGLALLTRPLTADEDLRLSQWPVEREVADGRGNVFGVIKAGAGGLVPASGQPDHPLDVVYAGDVRLAGYDLRGDLLAPGRLLELDLFWQALRWAPDDYVTFLQLQSVAGVNLAQHDSQLGGQYLATLWRPGIFVSDYYTLTVPSGLQPGKYRLVFGLYEPGTIRRLPARDASGPIDPALTLATLTVPDPLLDPSRIPNPQSVTAGDPPLLKLIGYEHGQPQPGQPWDVTLYWQALAPIPNDYTVFVHFFDAQGTLLAQQDGQPMNGLAPTSLWAPGEIVRDVHALDVPADWAPGPYRAAVGAYYWATGERLPLFDARGARLPNDLWPLPQSSP